MPHQYPMAVSNRYIGPVRLGSGLANRRNPQRGVCLHVGQTHDNCGQLPGGNKPWYALHLPDLHRLFQEIQRKSSTQKEPRVFYAAY